MLTSVRDQCVIRLTKTIKPDSIQYIEIKKPDEIHSAIIRIATRTITYVNIEQFAIEFSWHAKES